MNHLNTHLSSNSSSVPSGLSHKKQRLRFRLVSYVCWQMSRFHDMTFFSPPENNQFPFFLRLQTSCIGMRSRPRACGLKPLMQPLWARLCVFVSYAFLTVQRTPSLNYFVNFQDVSAETLVTRFLVREPRGLECIIFFCHPGNIARCFRNYFPIDSHRGRWWRAPTLAETVHRCSLPFVFIVLLAFIR